MSLSLKETKPAAHDGIMTLMGEDFTGDLFLPVSYLLPFDEAMMLEDAVLKRAVVPYSTPCCFIWSMPQCLVVPKGIAAHPEFKGASAAMKQAGWPVHVRQTGGDLTPQLPGVINISYVFSLPFNEKTCISTAYDYLCQPIMDYLLRDFGIISYCSSVDGAFCDGKYNVVIDGLKIAGTAQKWRQYKGANDERFVAVLGHVAILGDVDLPLLIGATNEFYKACNIDRIISTENHTTLADLVGVKNYNHEDIMAGLAQSFEASAQALM